VDDATFQTLHAIRVRGLASRDALSAALGTGGGLDRALDALQRDDLVAHKALPRREGWIITPAGSQRHDAELAVRRPALGPAVESSYDAFLRVNGTFKELCTDWQTAAVTAPDARAAFVADLREICDAAAVALAVGAEAAPWLQPYPGRLATALDRFAAGDDGWLISPLVDSVHTVWGEAHEDLLVTLARERSEADER
jgi:hypothetical protein